jgi:Tol biopolymer transport system component
MNADGSGRTRVAGTEGAGGVPVWSPDGTRLAFQQPVRGRNDLFVTRLDGSDRRRLTYGAEGRLR